MIRQYRESDLDQVISAWLAASRLAHPFLSEAFIDQERRNIGELYMPNTNTWVAEVDGEVKGFISLMGNEVGALFLHPDCHGKGIGRALMDKAQELHAELEVEVFEKNHVGRAFYARYGFLPIAQSHHEATGEPLLRLKFIRSVR